MNNRPVNGSGHVNGSSVHSSRSVTPEPVADLPVRAAQVYEQNEDRPPTPFPAVNIDAQPIDQVLADIIELPVSSLNRPHSPPPLPLYLPSSRGRGQSSPNPQPIDQPLAGIIQAPVSSFARQPSPSPLPLFATSVERGEQPLLNPQPSTSQSTSDGQLPIENIHHPFPGMPSAISSDSFQGIEHLVRRPQEDRERNEESRSRSIASGLYGVADMMMPGLPEYEPLDENETNNRSNSQFTRRLGMFVAIIGAIWVAKHFGKFLFHLNKH